MTGTRIALISATPLAIQPAAAAVTEAFPTSIIWNLLDDRLLADAQRSGITDALAARMDALIDYALDGEADAVLLTCSQYGARALARNAVADGAPVLSADGPLFDEVVAHGTARVLLVASLESAAVDSAERLRTVLAEARSDATVTSLVVADAARPTDEDTLAALLSTAVADVAHPFDLIVLAQYSLAPASRVLAEQFQVPVLDGPRAAARRLVAELSGRRS